MSVYETITGLSVDAGLVYAATDMSTVTALLLAGNDNLTGGIGDLINDFTTSVPADNDTLDLRPMWSTFTGTGGIMDVAGAVASGHLTFTQSGRDGDFVIAIEGGGSPPPLPPRPRLIGFTSAPR